VRIGRLRVYVEEGLPHTSVHLTYRDGRLRAEYGERTPAFCHCRWDVGARRQSALSRFRHYETDYGSWGRELFDPLWIRYPRHSLSNR
jgi:hypothetical protein